MAAVQRYDDVLVHEPGIDPWRGNVRAIKPPRPESKPDKNGKVTQLDQWADVQRDDGIVIIVPITYLEVIATLEDTDRVIGEVFDEILQDEDRAERASREPEPDPYADPFHGERNEFDEDEGRTGAPDDSRFVAS